MTQEIYNSSTLGPIPLSFTGRRLMANLREALEAAIGQAKIKGVADWKPISRARGELARYISNLERGRYTPETEEVNSLRVEYSEVKELEQPKTLVLNLPEIPPGYSLHAIGSIVTIEPNKPPEDQQREEFMKFCRLLDDYRDALLYQPPIARYPLAAAQERIDKARLAVVEAFEKARP
ncbi:MAG TPA: hypothetical protein VHK27_07070 [Gammaproteobacteria bacterium]|nr:hypothetical protein [Gammaproteobacteria bacterium]